MYRIAICDDEKAICYQIEQTILDYKNTMLEEIEVDVYYSGEELYKSLSNGNEYDILFLDIEFKQVNGVKIGEKIREELKNETIQIVYISGRQSYAMELFNIRPLNFLVKPLDSDRLIKVLKKGMDLLSKKYLYFTYKQGHNIKKIPLGNILYFESINRQVRMKTVTDEIIFYGSLATISSQLKGNHFYYTHKSYLVNFNHVIEFGYEQLMISDKTLLPISQSKRKKVREIQLIMEKEK